MNHKSGAALERKEFAFKADSVGETGTFIGYGSVFGNVDGGRDIVAKGAFVDSIAEMVTKGRKLPILWQHNQSEPIGYYEEVKEDDHGLLMTGRLLVDQVQRAKEAHALMKAGVLTGMSIGYSVVKDVFDSKSNIRTLMKLGLHETSLVTFPMNDEARVSVVKSIAEIIESGNLPTLPEFEGFLCEAGFSKTQAKAIAGNGLRKLLDRREADGDTSDVLKVLSDFSLH